MKTSIPPVLITFALVCFALVQNTQAVNPPPDGGYPGFNTAEGQNALFSLTTGVGNAAVGWYSLFSNTDGSFNTAVGAGTLLFNVGDQSTGEGTQNTAIGTAALLSNTTGSANTAVGSTALLNNTGGINNTAIGVNALNQNHSNNNTAIGHDALASNTGGVTNTAIAVNALLANTTGNFNTATGAGALSSNTIGDNNTAIGMGALADSTDGGSNTAVGKNALFQNTTGDDNIAVGSAAGGNVTNASHVICIGHGGANTNNSCFIGQIYTNIQPQVGTDPDLVTINSNGRLGRANVSSRRYKHDIQSMNKASEVIYGLKPVSFRYHKEYDASQTIAFGLIAEEVAEVNPNLVGRNPDGQAESVRYEQINAMLLNEFLKEHRKVEEQGAMITKQQKQIEALTAGLQKVSAQFEASKPAPQVAKNNQ